MVVLPLAAGAQQHGPHLPLGVDATLADYLIGRLLDSSDVVVAPPLTYHHFPAFVEYPGSPSLSLNTARDSSRSTSPRAWRATGRAGSTC